MITDDEKLRVNRILGERPICGHCGHEMTPKNAMLHPELFLCDACFKRFEESDPEVTAIEARARHNEGMQQRVLEHAVAFESPEATNEEKLLHCIRAAIEKLQINDAAGALLTLECALKL